MILHSEIGNKIGKAWYNRSQSLKPKIEKEAKENCNNKRNDLIF
jgi:hypothetical protein